MVAKKSKEKEKVIEHEFVSQHEVVKKEEERKILEKYGVIKNHLPKILKTDPAIRHLEVKKKDIIKITRESKTAGKVIYYRVVI